MWPLASLLLQAAVAPCPSVRAILDAEHARADSAVLVAALDCPDADRQRLAVRALGRFERPSLGAAIARGIESPHATVRREAVNAMGQSGARYDYVALLGRERDPAVRAVIHETMGRVTPTPEGAEPILAAWLRDGTPVERAGAARGLESLVRRTARTTRPATATVQALRAAVRDTARGAVGTELRELALLALVAAGDRDSLTFAHALRDSSEQVRRVAVLGGRTWTDDPSPIVRLQALRTAATCRHFVAAVNDTSAHVALAALDLLGERRCTDDATRTLLEAQADGRDWRRAAHAVVALARVAPAQAMPRVRTLAASPVWQARAYAAIAAKAVGDSATRAALAGDRDPNVVIAAMQGPADAIRALASTHAGLVYSAAESLKGSPALADARLALLGALDRFTAMRRARLRDPRVAVLQRLQELPVSNAMRADLPRWERSLRPLLRDADPEVAALAARVLSEKSGTPVVAVTTRYTPPPLPPAAFMAALEGATAIVRVQGVGTMTLRLRPDVAPAAVATFARLADRRRYDSLTFHRIVPNFVIQGGSPGANEYDPTTDYFMRDEVGLVRNARGTFGISTRGRDTGDGQIYANLIDNYRLDHDYTVFAEIVTGLDVMDRIQEGDVIESVRIVRAARR